MDQLVQESVHVIQRLTESKIEKRLLAAMLEQADGLVLLRMVKGGLGLTGVLGRGLVLLKAASGWSRPSALKVYGVGAGLQWGTEVVEEIVLFRTEEAANSFKGNQLAVGVEAGMVVGRGGGLGGAVHWSPGSPEGVALTLSGSKATGLFVGGGITGRILIENSQLNQAFYGAKVDVLGDNLPQPPEAASLYACLKQLCK